MDKAYNHQKHEKRIYSLWEKSGAFTPRVDKKKKPFTIIMPPPNASDPLHIGHARFVAIEDILTRYKRMAGFTTLWLPGADHAGIETQFVFEKKLAKEGKSRFDFDRETLYKMILDDVQKNKITMQDQLKVLGASCDWTREKFTLDPDIVAIVYKTFKKLYDEGLVYRGQRIVNFCPRCGTAYSQLEVEAEERDDKLYYLDYGPISIATTRPETIFADVAVAVNPKDSRHEKLVGKTAIIPLINREVPIIADELVDKSFGTGALKITPGHDSTDFAIGEKHHLETLSVIDKNGRMINLPEKYLGMKVAEAREAVVEDLGKTGTLKKTEALHHLVGVCYKGHGPIEPLISRQWFVKVEGLAKEALLAIEKKGVKFTASKYEKIAKHWLKNLKDWNISRQIVWGIRIPAWHCETCDEWIITDGSKPKECPKCRGSELAQDTDTFDTWFSSGQWPFATLMTTKPGDFEYFYPTSVMETAYDILPFWVIRMIMLGLYATDKVPFYEVLIHGLVRDKQGLKISKSKGNVIDPILMTEKYGSDALRMAIVWGAKVENDIALSEDNVRGQRNFANKIWNMGRYIESVFAGAPEVPFQMPKCTAGEDEKIIKDLANTVKETTKALEEYRLNEAIETLYEFAWHNFADKYIEGTKERARNKDARNLYILRHVYLTILKLTHPFAPFVTETVWQELKSLRKYPKESLISAPWPRV